MVRIIRTLIILLLFASVAEGQIHIVIPATDTITVAWDHDLLDVDGYPEMVIQFDLYLSHNDSDFVYLGSTDQDTVNYTPAQQIKIKIPLTTGKYILGVIAVDIAGNMSEMHKSTDVTAEYGGWYLLYDWVNPSKPSKFGVIK